MSLWFYLILCNNVMRNKLFIRIYDKEAILKIFERYSNHKTHRSGNETIHSNSIKIIFAIWKNIRSMMLMFGVKEEQKTFSLCSANHGQSKGRRGVIWPSSANIVHGRLIFSLPTRCTREGQSAGNCNVAVCYSVILVI